MKKINYVLFITIFSIVSNAYSMQPIKPIPFPVFVPFSLFVPQQHTNQHEVQAISQTNNLLKRNHNHQTNQPKIKRDVYGNTELHRAVINCPGFFENKQAKTNTGIIEMLIKNGALIYTINKNGDSPIDSAIKEIYPEIEALKVISKLLETHQPQNTYSLVRVTIKTGTIKAIEAGYMNVAKYLAQQSGTQWDTYKKYVVKYLKKKNNNNRKRNNIFNEIMEKPKFINYHNCLWNSKKTAYYFRLKQN